MKFVWLLFLLALTGCQERESGEKIKEVPQGYRGKARMNPYLAAETYLREKGWTVESSRVWAEESEDTSLLIMPGSFLQSSGMVLRVLDWVAEGRTLVVTIEGGEPERNDFTDRTSGVMPEEGEFSGVDELLESLGIERVNHPDPNANAEMEPDGALSRPWEVSHTGEGFGGYALEFEGSVGLRARNGWHWTPPLDGSSRVVGTTYGSGAVLVFAHARPFRNPYLARADHAEFLEYLAVHYGGDRMVFLYGSSTSFFGMVWQKGKMAVIGGLMVLVFWLWMRIPRFGPVMQDRAIQSRPYGEALTTSARFLWRTGQLGALFKPLRQRVGNKQGTSPQREGADDPDGIPDELPKDPGLILKIVQKLQHHLRS